MRVLLDVSLLLAVASAGHAEHQVARKWFAASGEPRLLTGAITELGFVRISVATRLQPSVAEAVGVLERWKADFGVSFVADASPACALPDWVQSPAQTTDGHLLELARSQHAQFATPDRGIPGALLVR